MSLALLAEIGIKALRLQEATDTRKIAAEKFGNACAEWKHRHGFQYIAKEAPEWKLMLNDLDAEYMVVRAAKDLEINARSRLARACHKAQKELAAGAAAEQAVRKAMKMPS